MRCCTDMRSCRACSKLTCAVALLPQAADVAYASTALRKGAQLLKFCRRGKPHACHVQLAPDECEIQWVSAAGRPKAVRLAAVKDVVAGQTTALFRCV